MLTFRRSKGSWLPFYLFASIAATLLFSLPLVGTARAASDSYSKIAQVPIQPHTISCTFANGTVSSSTFTFDISFVAQARGEYLLAQQSQGRPEHFTEGGLLSGLTSGALLDINTDDPGAGPSYILPPRNDPFSGHRCDSNTAFGGLSSRSELDGPNGVFTVNDTQAWVGDGPSYFTPGQTNTAADYKTDPCDSSVRVFSLITKQQIAHIDTHGCFRTDEGAFDAVDQVALYANPSEQASVEKIDPRARPVDHSPFISLISTRPGHGRFGDDSRGDGRRFGDDFRGDFGRGHGQGQYRILKQINFDGTNGTVDATGGIEQAVYSRQTGDFYISIPANNNPGTVGTTSADGFVTVVDPTPGHMAVVANYALASGSCPGGPAGAALGPNHELLLGCGGASATGGEVVVDIANLATSTANPTILADGSQSCDEVAYDAGSGHFGGACFGAKPGLFNLLVNDAHTNPVSVDLTLPGGFGAHSVAADSLNGQFWMPMSGGACGLGTDCVVIYGGNDSDAQGS